MAEEVFISYSSADRALAEQLVLELGQLGITFWRDEIAIGWGELINEKVAEGVNNARFVVVLITDNSLKSNWVRKEVNTALHREAEKGETVLLPYVLCNPDDVFEKLPDIKMKKFINQSTSFNVAALQIKQLLVGPVSDEFIFNYPSTFVGQIWIRVSADKPHGGKSHSFSMSWGPWYREFSHLIASDQDTYFTHTKLDDLSLPIRITVNPSARVSFGMGKPPGANVVDINPFWVDVKSKLARFFAKTFLWPKR